MNWADYALMGCFFILALCHFSLGLIGIYSLFKGNKKIVTK